MIKIKFSMEEKKKKKLRFRFPLWLEFVKIVFVLAFIVIAIINLRNGILNETGLIIPMIAIWFICEFYRLFEESEMDSSFVDILEDMKSEINCLEQENAELRNVVKNYSKDEKKPSKKTKKSND